MIECPLLFSGCCKGFTDSRPSGLSETKRGGEFLRPALPAMDPQLLRCVYHGALQGLAQTACKLGGLLTVSSNVFWRGGSEVQRWSTGRYGGFSMVSVGFQRGKQLAVLFTGSYHCWKNPMGRHLYISDIGIPSTLFCVSYSPHAHRPTHPPHFVLYTPHLLPTHSGPLRAEQLKY